MRTAIELTMTWADVPLDRIQWHLSRRHMRAARKKTPV